MHAEHEQQTDGNAHGDQEPSSWLWLVASLLAVGVMFFGIVVLQWWLVQNFSEAIKAEHGLSGDLFGFANAVFSALAFAILIVTLWLQKHELKLQRNEIRLTQQELAGQKEQMILQNATSEQQAFDVRFFQLLHTLNEVIGGLQKPMAGYTPERLGAQVNGRACFPLIWQQKPKELFDVEAYTGWLNSVEILTPYFRTLYNIFKYVDTSDVKNKRFYTNIVRAQLSDVELKLLFYNCLSPLGENKFKPLVERYALLKHLHDDKASQYRDRYGESAYGRNAD